MPPASALEYIKKNRLAISIGVATLILVDICQLLIPRVTKHAIDDLTYLRVEPSRLLSYALTILCLALLIAGLRYIWRRCLIGASRKIEKDIRGRLFSHLQTLDAAYFNQTSTGDLMARATNDINNIRMAAGFGMVALTDAIFLGTAAIGFMAYISVELTLYSLIPMPFIVVLTKFFSNRMHKGFQQVQAAFSDLTETVRERLVGIRVIKAFARQEAEVEKLAAISRNYVKQNMKLVKITGTFFPMMIFFTTASVAIVLFYGGRQTIFSEITSGDFVAFVSYLGLLTWPMMALGWVTNMVQRGRASLERINQVLESEPEIKTDPAALSLPPFSKTIKFDKVSFTYPPQPDIPEKKAHHVSNFELHDISFTLPKGETLCLVGPPGSGKTTLANLLARLYDPQSGTISIDNQDIKKVKIDDLRGQMSFMPQEPFLFSATIKDNITFKTDIPDDDPELVAAASKADLYETVQNVFTHGFETMTGERGVILSGGQKQRVALARSFYHQAPIMIMDDPVSQVDTETAGKIIKSLKEIAAEKTVLFISHRLSLAQSADQILVLQEGRLTESGTHAELLQAGGYYARVWQIQQLEEMPHE